MRLLYSILFLFMLLFASCKNINESKQDTGTSLLTDSVENKESIVPSSAVEYAEGNGVLKSIDAAGVVNNEIKEKKAELRTEMMKTNPIQKTFYGSALGTKSVRSIVNQLKNLGYEVEKFGNGQYFCDISGKVDDVYWNSIRIVSINGKLTHIVLTRDYRLGWGATKRFFSKEVKQFYEQTKSIYDKKYSFWSKSTSVYEDEKTLLKLEHDECYTVWATYSLK